MIKSNEVGEFRRLWRYFDGCERVLDLGMGSGNFGRARPSGHRCVCLMGLDRKFDVGHTPGYVGYKEEDAEKRISFDDEFFNGILARDVFEHFLRPLKVMESCYRVLGDGGIIVLTVPNPGRKAWDDYEHVRPFTRRSIVNLLEDAHFKVVRVRRTRGFPGVGMLGLGTFVSGFLCVFPSLSTGWEVVGVK